MIRLLSLLLTLALAGCQSVVLDAAIRDWVRPPPAHLDHPSRP